MVLRCAQDVAWRLGDVAWRLDEADPPATPAHSPRANKYPWTRVARQSTKRPPISTCCTSRAVICGRARREWRLNDALGILQKVRRGHFGMEAERWSIRTFHGG